MGGGKRIRITIGTAKRMIFILLVFIVVFLTSCYDNTNVFSEEDILYTSLSNLVEQLQLQVEEFVWQQNQNKLDIEKNSRAIQALSEALEKNTLFVDSLYASMTYASIFNHDLDLTQQQKIPTMEEIKRLVEEQSRKKLEAFENTYIPTLTSDSTGEETEKLQKEIALLRENFKSLKWQLYKNDPEPFSKDDYLVYDDKVVYQVQSGDTLSQIANAFGLGPNGANEIMALNNINDPRAIRRGQELIIQSPPVFERIQIPLYGRKNLIPSDILTFYAENTQDGFSRGLTFVAPDNQEIVSCLPGRVIDKGISYVVIYHGNDIKLVYSDLQDILIDKGDWVTGGQIIGTSHNNSFTLEFILNAEYRDPMKLFLKQMGQFRITFYTEWEDGNLPYFPYFRRVKDGSFAKEWYSVAADPALFEKGTMIYIPELKGTPSKGLFIVEDEGSAIKGNAIDVYIRDLTLASLLQTYSVVYRFP
ncbi:MAG: LysM peptidoglycan-binding domain-containing protein [Thermotogota bacterium]|nr:LysM peptidoglycan-binding domain-containing protein [Thermotogota bacterium]